VCDTCNEPRGSRSHTTVPWWQCALANNTMCIVMYCIGSSLLLLLHPLLHTTVHAVCSIPFHCCSPVLGNPLIPLSPYLNHNHG
jgi:hypothetical protein